jgi:hypothetical protein
MTEIAGQQHICLCVNRRRQHVAIIGIGPEIESKVVEIV